MKSIHKTRDCPWSATLVGRDRPGTIFPPGPGPGIGARTGAGDGAGDTVGNIHTISPAPVTRRGRGRGDRANRGKTKFLRFGGNHENHKKHYFIWILCYV